MPVDPGLFMQAAQLQIASRNQLSNDLSNAMKMRSERINKGLDFDKLVQRAAINVESGRGTPEDYQYLKAKDLIEGPKMVFDQATQNLVSSGTIMDRLEKSGARQYTPSFPPLGSAPVTQEQTMPQQPVGALNAIPALSMGQLEQPMPRMGGMPPAALTQQQQDALNARGDVMNRPAPALPQITAPVGSSSKTTQAAQETTLDLQKKIKELDYENQIKLANEMRTKGVANNTVSGILSRMSDINDQLLKRKAIVSSSGDMKENIKAGLSSTLPGRNVRKYAAPETQALALEYGNLQSVLLPFYASASGLGSKSLDSNAERESLLKSFGDPYGIYDTNKMQIQNLKNTFGIDKEQNKPKLAPDGNYYIEDKNRPGKYLKVNK